MNQLHVIISGDVQGVGFRSWVLRHAQNKQLKGWVKNRDDGAVEAVFEGPQEQLDAMLAQCKVGPMTSMVKQVESAWNSASNKYDEFVVRK